MNENIVEKSLPEYIPRISPVVLPPLGVNVTQQNGIIYPVTQQNGIIYPMAQQNGIIYPMAQQNGIIYPVAQQTVLSNSAELVSFIS
jgi:hypothetical protein